MLQITNKFAADLSSSLVVFNSDPGAGALIVTIYYTY